MYSGVIFLIAVGAIFFPLFHRIIHAFCYAGNRRLEGNGVEGEKTSLYENRRQTPLKRSEFYFRLLRHMLVAAAVLLVSVVIGIIGYKCIIGLKWLDAFYVTNMVITTEGTIINVNTPLEKLFVSLLSIYAFIIFLVAMGVIFSPLLHRLLHAFWHAGGRGREKNKAEGAGGSSFEDYRQRPINRSTFYKRVVWYFTLLYIILAVSLIPGMFGYRYVLGVSWLDSFYNACMILSNEGPVIKATTAMERLFVSFYSMVTTVIFLVAIGIALSPVLHRLMHTFWYGEQDPDF
jgi:hypothetical protein